MIWGKVLACELLVSRFIGYLEENARAIDADRHGEPSRNLIAAGICGQELRLWTSLLDPTKAPALELAQLYARRWEQEVWHWYDACLAVSPLEAQRFREETDHRIPVWVVPTGGGIDLDKFPWVDTITDLQEKAIVYLGAMEWYPNAQGLIWFIDEAMPLLRKTAFC
jgi:hypothetical protein